MDLQHIKGIHMDSQNGLPHWCICSVNQARAGSGCLFQGDIFYAIKTLQMKHSKDYQRVIRDRYTEGIEIIILY